jgi:hypothetical protein
LDEVPGLAVSHHIQRLRQPDPQVNQLGILGHHLDTVGEILLQVLQPLLLHRHFSLVFLWYMFDKQFESISVADFNLSEYF